MPLYRKQLGNTTLASTACSRRTACSTVRCVNLARLSSQRVLANMFCSSWSNVRRSQVDRHAESREADFDRECDGHDAVLVVQGAARKRAKQALPSQIGSGERTDAPPSASVAAVVKAFRMGRF